MWTTRPATLADLDLLVRVDLEDGPATPGWEGGDACEVAPQAEPGIGGTEVHDERAVDPTRCAMDPQKVTVLRQERLQVGRLPLGGEGRLAPEHGLVARVAQPRRLEEADHRGEVLGPRGVDPLGPPSGATAVIQVAVVPVGGDGVPERGQEVGLRALLRAALEAAEHPAARSDLALGLAHEGGCRGLPVRPVLHDEPLDEAHPAAWVVHGRRAGEPAEQQRVDLLRELASERDRVLGAEQPIDRRADPRRVVGTRSVERVAIGLKTVGRLLA